jgi:tetratricopeptide (TPR) repeat protein
MRTAGSQRQPSPPDAQRPAAEAAAAGARLQRVAFVTAAAALLLAIVAGAVHSVLSRHRVPSANLLVDGPADHIEDLLKRKEYDAAVRQLVAYEPLSNDRLPHERMAEVLLQLGPEARQAVAQALRNHPGYARGHFQLGLAFLGADEYDSAAAQLNEALRLSPTFPEAHNALGIVLAYQGQGEEAAAHFWQALAQMPGYPEARENLERIAPLFDRAPPPEP